MTAQDIEIAVAHHFDYRRNVIVPNVHWGMGLHYEADLVVLRPSGWAVEVEIKISAADIRADLKKWRQHDSPLFRQLYFAVPLELADNPNIPEHAGILAVSADKWGRNTVKPTRGTKLRRDAVKWTAEQRHKLLHLAAMRTWTLKQHLARRAG